MNKVVLAFAVTALAVTAFSPLDAREFKYSGCADAALRLISARLVREGYMKIVLIIALATTASGTFRYHELVRA
jgi:hypothetical protein